MWCFVEYGYETILTGITENIIQIPLPPGDEYQLVLSPVDFTDNRHDFENIKQKNSIRVYFPRIQGIIILLFLIWYKQTSFW